jgi:hypothetical protein
MFIVTDMPRSSNVQSLTSPDGLGVHLVPTGVRRYAEAHSGELWLVEIKQVLSVSFDFLQLS